MKSLKHALDRQITGLLVATCLWVCFDRNALAQKDQYAPKPEVPPGFYLVGGDILIPLLSPQSPFPTDRSLYWPGGIVPYEFDPNVTQTSQDAMLIAMAEWEAVASVQFIPRNGQGDYVHIQNSVANNSSMGIGRVGGALVINIYNWDRTFIMAHELGHCLGFDHTQTRADRANFITINYENVQPMLRNNFDVAVGFHDYGPYDFDSVMEYGQCDLSIDCTASSSCFCSHHVIEVLPPNETYWQTRIGQRDHLSEMDKLIMSFLYPRGDWLFVDQAFSASPQNGTFPNPFTTFVAGESAVPANGTVWIQPGSYSAVGAHSKPMVIRAPLGDVVLGN